MAYPDPMEDHQIWAVSDQGKKEDRTLVGARTQGWIDVELEGHNQTEIR